MAIFSWRKLIGLVFNKGDRSNSAHADENAAGTAPPDVGERPTEPEARPKEPTPEAEAASASSGATQPTSCWGEATLALRNERPADWEKLQGIVRKAWSDRKASDPLQLRALRWRWARESGRVPDVVAYEAPPVFASAIRALFLFEDVEEGVDGFDPQECVPYAQRGLFSFEFSGRTLATASLASPKDVVQVVERVSSHLAHWANAESRYLGPALYAPRPFTPLGPRLVGLYRGILDLEIALVNAMDEGRNGSDKESERMDGQGEVVVEWKSLVDRVEADHEACQQVLVDGKQKMDATDQEIKSWLSGYRADLDHAAALKRTGVGETHLSYGTCLLSTKEFKRWSSKQSEVGHYGLWIRGTAGTGKSTTFARIVQWHLERSGLFPEHHFAYVYCSRGQDSKSRHSHDEVLRAILLQVAYDPVTGVVHGPVRDAFERAQDGTGGRRLLTGRECADIIRSMARIWVGLKLRIMIDAVDECDEPNRLLSTLVSGCNLGRLWLLFSSRQCINVLDSHPEARTIDLTPERAEGEMIRYIRTQVRARTQLGEQHRSLEQRLVNALQKRAGGMYGAGSSQAHPPTRL